MATKVFNRSLVQIQWLQFQKVLDTSWVVRLRLEEGGTPGFLSQRNLRGSRCLGVPLLWLPGGTPLSLKISAQGAGAGKGRSSMGRAVGRFWQRKWEDAKEILFCLEIWLKASLFPSPFAVESRTQHWEATTLFLSFPTLILLLYSGRNERARRGGQWGEPQPGYSVLIPELLTCWGIQCPQFYAYIMTIVEKPHPSSYVAPPRNWALESLLSEGPRANSAQQTEIIFEGCFWLAP